MGKACWLGGMRATVAGYAIGRTNPRRVVAGGESHQTFLLPRRVCTSGRYLMT